MSASQIALLKKYGLPLRRVSGQHLLTDPNIQRKIIELVDPKPKEWILEIGPGLGALTAEILAAGASVIAVEKDRWFCEILEGELGRDYKGRFKIVNADILETSLPSLRGVCRRQTTKQSGNEIASPRQNIGGARNDDQRKFKIVSNLPYYITSPVLFWLIENRSYIEKAVLMMQREVARRILAQPGNKDYGRLTLAIRYYAEIERAFDVSRNCFSPKPEVDSSVITLDFHPPSKLPKGIDEDFLFHLIQVAFGARRKTLLNRFVHDPEIGKSRDELVEILKKLGLPPNARGEDLLLKDFMAIAMSLRSQ